MNHRFKLRLGSDLEALKPSKGLFSEGIFDSNIDASDPVNIRIALWREWRAMLTDLCDVGPVWSIVRNGHCVLAVHGDYPQLTYTSDRQSAVAHDGDSSLACHFHAWRQAAAFDSGCHCGRVYGVEIENERGQIFHRVCLGKETDLEPFIEWTQMHQATGLEEEVESTPSDQNRFHPQSFRRAPGTLEVPLERLRTALIQAAQREIPLIAAVISEGMTQTTRLEIIRASEAHGQLVLSGNRRTLYVATEPVGSLLVEPAIVEGETLWRLSLVNTHDDRLMHLQGGLDERDAWNQLIREFVLCSTTWEP